ncbi:amidohydrolase family protein [Nonomuraea longicatena]|uniref:Aminodeoxyfutalosine deaminase/Imidazolonepropionase-like composite domain-containing protein n=1 Tax=Nonomuraea longicatena TaxID=83682 RepID=A0ABP3Z477_9ACTN
MPSAVRAPRVLGKRAPGPVLVHTAPLVLPICADPLRDGAVAIRADRVLQVGPRDRVLRMYPAAEETRWPGMIVAGLVDACAAPAPPAPGVTARAAVVRDLLDPPAARVTYVEVAAPSEEVWECSARDALITAIREFEAPHAIGMAPRTADPHVLEDVAVLARTFGLRMLVELGRHSPAALDEAGVLGPHCHVAGGGQLDPGERKLLRLRRSSVAVCPSPGGADDTLALIDEGNPLAFGTAPSHKGPPPFQSDPPGEDLLGHARAVRAQAKARGLRVSGLDRRLVEAATVGGARALGLDFGPGRIGVLARGARADLAVYDARGRYPYSALLSAPPCLATITAGVVTHRA